MNVSFPIPEEVEDYIKVQLQSGVYSSVADYFLALLSEDRQRKEAQERLARLLQEGLDSEAEAVTPGYWQELRLSVLETAQQEV